LTAIQFLLQLHKDLFHLICIIRAFFARQVCNNRRFAITGLASASAAN